MELRKIILEEMDDLEWMKDIDPDAIYVGALFRIDNNSGKPHWLERGLNPDEYVIIQITNIDNNSVDYQELERNLPTWWVSDRKGTITMDRLQNLIDIGFWQPFYDPKYNINEQEDDLEWMKDIGHEIKSCNDIEVGMRVRVTSNFDNIGVTEELGTVDSKRRGLFTVAFDTPIVNKYTTTHTGWNDSEGCKNSNCWDFYCDLRLTKMYKV